jgi:predicted nucleic acid-binding protein
VTALVLDTRAVELLADPKADLQAARRMRDILDSADRMGIPVRIPSAVLAEAYRGIPADAAIDRVLGHGIRPITLGQAAARQAGGLRYRDRLDSCHTVDALVVATAIRLGGGIIATGDPDDLRSLAREHTNIKVQALSLRLRGADRAVQSQRKTDKLVRKPGLFLPRHFGTADPNGRMSHHLCGDA